MTRQALFECTFEIANHMQVKNVFDGGVIGCIMLHFKPSALIRWRAENRQVSMEKFQKWGSTAFHQLQGFSILANFGNPILTVGTDVILQVFDSLSGRIKVNIQLVVNSLARIFDTQSKIRDIVMCSICTILNDIGSFDWPSQGYPSRLLICLCTANL